MDGKGRLMEAGEDGMEFTLEGFFWIGYYRVSGAYVHKEEGLRSLTKETENNAPV